MMKKIASVCVAAVLMMLSAIASIMADPEQTAATGDPVQMTAEYMLFSGSSLRDPPPGAKIDTVGIYISGEAAWKIYYAMDVPVQSGGCDGNMRYKEAGDFICYLTDTAHCDIGINLKSGKTTSASDC